VVSRCNKAHVMVYVWDIVQVYSALCIDEDSLGGLVHKGCFVRSESGPWYWTS
jgi:hypothetical protein